jgi:hypothetical protein
VNLFGVLHIAWTCLTVAALLTLCYCYCYCLCLYSTAMLREKGLAAVESAKHSAQQQSAAAMSSKLGAVSSKIANGRHAFATET